MNQLLIRIFILCLLLPFSLTARQTENSTELNQYLNHLRDNYDINLAYDPDLISGFQIDSPGNDPSLEEVVENLNSQLPFSFELMEGSYLIIKTKPITLNLTIKDLQTDGVIPGVYVKKNGQYAQIVSDADGRMTLNTEWRKNDTLSFEFLGYESYNVAIRDLLISGQRTIQLGEGKTVLNELIINGYLGNGISANQQNHSLNIKTEDLGMLPGDTNKDLLVSLRSLPGITSVTGRAGELRVRGSTPDQTLLLFNNIPIYHKGYYYGTISPFSTDVVNEVRVYRSGYSPRLGGRVGGAIEITSDDAIPQKTSGGLATSSVFASAFIKTNLADKKLGMTFSARTSHPFDYRSPLEKEYEKMVAAASALSVNDLNPAVDTDPITFDFRDFNGSLVYRPDERNQLKFNFLTINNENKIGSVDNNRNVRLEINTELDNSGYNLEWGRQLKSWSNQLFVTSAYYLYQTNQSNYSTIDGRRINFTSQDNTLRTFRLGNILSYVNPESFNTLSLGYEMTNLQSDLSLERAQAAPPPGGNPAPPAPEPADPLPQKGTVHSFFTSYQINDWHQFMVDAGFRSNYYTRNGSFRLEPRIFMNYYVNDRLTLKSSMGSYSQFITRNIFFNNSDLPVEKLSWNLVINRDDEIITSRQFLVGAVHQSDHWVIDLEVYSKEVNNVVTNGPEIAGLPPEKLVGDIRSKGADLLIKRRINKLDVWANYTLSKTEMFFPRLKTEYFPANYDQRHIVNIASSYQKDRFRASLGWIWSSGIPNYLDDSFFPATGPGANMPLPEPTALGEVERFGAVHQLDASAAYHFFNKKKNTKITIGVSFLNIYDNDNLLEVVNVPNRRNPSDITAANRYTIGFAPDFMLKIEW